MFPLQSVTYKIGKSCCCKVIGDNAAYNLLIICFGCANKRAANVREENANDINKLLQFFVDCHSQNTQFRWAPKLDSNGEIHSLFWSHASMQGEYAHFGDVVTFDTTHKTNLYEKTTCDLCGCQPSSTEHNIRLCSAWR
jgi:hypothetical protein